jgi:predicted amidohydrolase YtcJ
MSDRVELIVYGGKILTVDEVFTITEAVAIKDDKFIAVGADDEILALADATTKIINLKGKTAMPGIIDSHNHMSKVAPGVLLPLFTLSGSLRPLGINSISDLVSVIGKEAAQKREGEWIQTSMVNMPSISTDLKENRYPNRWDLDPVSPDNPVYISATHAGIINSYALKLLNITKETPQPEGGEIVKDPDTGEPTGVLSEAPAMGLATNCLPVASEQEIIEAEIKLCQEYNKVGLTSIQEHGINSTALAALQTAKVRDEITCRLYVHYEMDWPQVKSLEYDLDMIKRLHSFANYKGFGDTILKIGGIGEIVFNGVMSEEKLRKIVHEAVKNDLRVGVHAHYPQGGKSLDKCLAIFEEINDEMPKFKDQRHLILHGTFPKSDTFDICKRLNLFVSCQTGFLYTHPWWADLDKTRTALPIRDWLDHGIKVGLSSDAPVNPINPFWGMWHAITRTNPDGMIHCPDQRITREEAIKCYTIHNAYGSFEENVKGSIETGKLADIVVLDNDILTCPIEEIKDIRVLLTIVGGRIVYQSPNISEHNISTG